MMMLEYLKETDENIVSIRPGAGNFLIESGLLFEINRRILHPLGLALCVTKAEDEEYKLSDTIIDARHVLGGLNYDKETLVLAEDSICAFMEDFGVGKMQERQKKLGYIVQRSDKKRYYQSL